MSLLLLITTLSFFSVHSQVLTKPILKLLNSASAKEKELLLSKRDLQEQQTPLSMVDQFAKYSKIQRKINIIDEELKDLQSQRSSNSILVSLLLKYGLKVPIALVLLIITLYYRHTPVFVLNEKFDLFPLTNLVSYPNTVINAVSVHFWIICSTSISKLIKIN